MNSMNRRRFLASGALATPLLSAMPPAHAAQAASQPTLMTGNGQWTYTVVPQWGHLPAGTVFGGTHGAIATDDSGLLYVSTQSNTGILVYRPDGTLLRTIASEYPEVHSLVHAVEGSDEVFHAIVQKGTPNQNWLYMTMKLDGTVVRKITAPPEAGFKTPNEWRITSAVPAPDGDLWIANGYGDSRLFRFDRKGNFKAAHAGKGDTDGLFRCCHGLAVDTRYDQPLLLVCDRENRRLVHLDFDGKFVRTVTQHLRRPCQVSFHGEHAVVSELEGRVTILDKDNAVVAFLGDNPSKTQWAKYDLDPASIAPASFAAAHGCFIDSQANIFISDWNHTGRITKLVRSVQG